MDLVLVASALGGGAVLLGLWLSLVKRRRAKTWTKAARGDLLRERRSRAEKNG